MTKKESIQKYIDGWKEGNSNKIMSVLTNDCFIIESHGPTYNGKEIITLGVIGLNQIPKKPRVFCTGNNKKIIQKYKVEGVNNNIYGTVGPIIGVSGLLLGLAGRKDIPAISFLAETFGHPQYLGVDSAREILKVLNKTLKLGLNLNELDSEIKEMEKEFKKTGEIEKIQKAKKVEKKEQVNYIG